VPTSPDAIKRFLLHKPDLPPIEFRGADPEMLHDIIFAAGDHSLLTKTLPRRNQLEGLAFALWAKRALLFYEMRTGKTKLALDFISYLIYSEKVVGRALIIAHAPIGADEWENQIPFHSHLIVERVSSGPDSYERFIQAAQGDSNAILISWSTLQQIFSVSRSVPSGRDKGKAKLYVDRQKCRALAHYFDVAVIDEIHMAGHHDTLRFGIASELLAYCEWRLGLTGTPFGRDPMLLWAQAFLMDSGQALGRSYYFFREAFGVAKYNPFTRSATDYVFDAKKLPLLREKMQSLVLTCQLREIQDVNVLPGIVRLSMSREQRAAYEEVVDHLVQLRMGNIVEIENTFIRLRQVASGFLPFVNDAGEERVIDFLDAAKLIWLEDFIAELPKDMKCVIFHEFIHSGERICQLLKKLKIKHEWLYGGSKDRPALIKRFQEGSSQILVANAATGGMSINLSAADYLMFFEAPVSVIARKQAEARPLARGSRPLVIDDLVCAPIEQKILDFHAEGRSLLEELRGNPSKAKDLLL
jgi:SNF2 family DNA or RNA helicase